MKKQNNVENFINNNISFKPDYSKIKDKVTTIIQESISQNDYHLRLNFQISIIFRFFLLTIILLVFIILCCILNM
jgi:hypothetical protein